MTKKSAKKPKIKASAIRRLKGKPVPVTRIALDPPRIGAPTKYTPEIVEAILSRMMKGETLLSIGRDPELPDPRTIHKWVLSNPEFAKLYHEARRIQSHVWADQIKEISENPMLGTKTIVTTGGKDGPSTREETYDAVERARLNVDTAKWILARMNRADYGDRVDSVQEVNVTKRVQIEKIVRVVVDPKGKIIDARGT